MNAYRAARILTCLLVLAPSHAPRASAPEGDERPLITVTGQAELNVPPDEAVFDLEVSRVEKDLAAARRQVDESVRQILSIARANGVAQDDVKTDHISVGMRYSTDYVEEDEDDAKPKKVKREFVGYAVTKSVAVRLTDLSRFDKLFAEVLAAGVSKVDGVRFRTSQIRKYKDQARAMAIRAAREKAVALAAELGQSVGRAFSIEEEGDSSRSSAMANSTGYVASNLSADERSSFAPGTISVTARVTVKFLLN